MQSLIEATKIQDNLDMSQLHLIREEREIGAVDNNGNPVVYSSVEQVMDKVISYNNSHENVSVSIEDTNDGVVLKVKPNTIYEQRQKDDIAFNNKLNRKLEKILNDVGFAISRDDELSRFGVFDPRHAFTTAQGLKAVIRISRNMKGE